MVSSPHIAKSSGFITALFVVIVSFAGFGQEVVGVDAEVLSSTQRSAPPWSSVAAAIATPLSPATDPASAVPVQVETGSPRPSTDGRSPITLAFAGDTSFHNALHLRSPLVAAQRSLELPDFTILNLETSIAPPTVGAPQVQKEFLFRSDPAAVTLLSEAGVDAVTLANNHALDFGPAALEYGIDALTAAGIETVGAGANPAEAYTPLLVDVGAWRIGIAAFSRVPCDWSWAGENVRPQVAWACPAFLEKAEMVVAEMVEQVDVAVVMVHGGTEGQLCADPTMRSLNERWAALGAALIVNSHPHVVQGITSIEETIVIQSTGNFAFPPSTGLTANSGVFLATVSEQGVTVTVDPFVSEGGVLHAGSRTRRASILDQIDQYSTGWSILSDGRAVQELGHAGLCP